MPAITLPASKFSGEEASIIAQSKDISSFAAEHIFADDCLIDRKYVAGGLQNQGVIWLPLLEAMVKHPDLVAQYFMDQTPELGSEKFEALHGSLVSNGTFLYVPANVEITLPLVSYHWNVEDKAAVFPHTLIVAEANTRVNVVDIFRSTEKEQKNFICGMANIHAGPGAQVFYKAVQEWSQDALSFHLNTVTADRDSNVKTVMLCLGSAQSRSEQHTRIIGAGSNVENYSLSVSTEDQEYDQRTLQTHSAPHSRSDLLYKNALLDDSRTIFSGLIKVDEIAQQTDAYQTNRNLLLSDRAESNSMPGLEILANDVKCSHGATTGKLDEDQLFYLKTRGIPTRQAQKLLVFGFFEEILEKLNIEELAKNVRDYIQNKFHQ